MSLKTEITRKQSVCLYVSGGKKCSFFGKFGVLSFLVTSVLRLAFLSYYRQVVGILFVKEKGMPAVVHNLLSASPTKWSNTLKQFVGNLLTNCLSVFDHFVRLALKGIMPASKKVGKTCTTEINNT